MKPNVLILTGYGINAEKELKWAFDLAGAESKIVHLQDLIDNPAILDEYQILGFPGGFSFGDHIASGKVFANLVKYNLYDKIQQFTAQDKLVIGICNGFQVIVKLGLVPAVDEKIEQTVSLIHNDSGCFEDRWVWVDIHKNSSPWLTGLNRLYIPVRHGEGKFITPDPETTQYLIDNNYAVLRYVNPENPGETGYPYNPNGSHAHIAGLINKKGNVLGLMPHPEAYIFKENHPRWSEGIEEEKTGLSLFTNAVSYFS